MNTAFLQPQLQLPYRRETWLALLPQLLPGVELFRQPADSPLTTEAQRAIATGLSQLGRAVLRDGQGNERIIAIFEADVAAKVDLLRNRVALRQLVARCIDEVSAHAVLAFFVQPGVPAYRLTYAARESVLGDALQIETCETATKRYTYVLGPGEARRTAAQRLAGLAERRDTAAWKDITDAFSVEKLNDEFFQTYKEHYQAFCKHLLDSNAPTAIFGLNLRGLKDKDRDKALKPVRDFVKKLLGRLVFLHFLQKKGWLGCPAGRTDWRDGDAQFLRSLFEACRDQTRFHSRSLVPLFFDTLNNPNRPDNLFALTGTRIPYLNGGLFERDFAAVDQIDFPAAMFAGLLDFFGQYNFTIDENDPDDHEIGIDPEMLGHIFENLLEDNKDKGAYYTPKAIVQYMCQQSLICYLQGKLPDDPAAHAEIERLIRRKDPIDPRDPKDWLARHATQLEALLDDVKICDPAIGSGAFPIGLLQEIYWTKLTLHPAMDRARAKRDIIQKSIHGVDIDAGAVEIARLRCWLALIVEEDQPRPLPNLDYKIMQGDSLLESFEGIPLDQLMPSVRPLYDKAVEQKEMDLGPAVREKLQLELSEEDRQRFAKLLGDYFPCEDPAEKTRLHAEIDGFVLKHLDFNVDQYLRKEEAELAQLQKSISEKRAKARKYTLSPRESRRVKILEANIRANRARKVELHKLRDKHERPYFLWHLFFQDVFAHGGFDIVIGNPPYGRILRRQDEAFVATRFPAFSSTRDVFVAFVESAAALARPAGCLTFIVPTAWLGGQGYTCFRQQLCTLALQQIVVLPFDIFKEVYVDTLIVCIENRQADDSHLVRTYSYPKRAKVKEISITAWDRIPLQRWRESADCKFILSGAMVGLTERLRSACPRRLKDLVEMKRGVLFDRSMLTEARTGPNSHPYFEGDVYRYRVNYFAPQWVEYGPAMREYPKEFRWFSGRRILLRRLVNRKQRLMAALVDGTFITNKNLYSLLPKPDAPDLKVILALLNSALMSRLYIEQVSQATKDDFPQVTIADILELPAPSEISQEDVRALSCLVDKMALPPGREEDGELDALNSEIDGIVNRMYGLTPEENVLLAVGPADLPAALDVRTSIFGRILPGLTAATPYVSHTAVARRLADAKIEIADQSLRVYLSQAMKKGIVHDAGRGWYSCLEARCELDPKPVAKVVRQLEKEFPLLDFAVWSTQQVNPWMHHLLAKFIAFVLVDADGLSPVVEFLRAQGYEVHADPKGQRAAEVRPNGKTVVVRPRHSHAPRYGHFSPPEAVLVDLFLENRVLQIMDAGEFRDMAQRLATSGRLLWATLSHYAEKRGVSLAELFADAGVLSAES